MNVPGYRVASPGEATHFFHLRLDSVLSLEAYKQFTPGDCVLPLVREDDEDVVQ